MEQAVLKTLAGFLNKGGGMLFVGVSNDGSPIGLDADGFESEERMGLHLTNIVNQRMGKSTWASMHLNFDDFEDSRVMVVRCEKARSPVYVSEGTDERFYVRTGPSTTELSVSQAMEYIKQRFG